MAVSDFEGDLREIPGELCAPFYESAHRLETAILTIFRHVSLCTKDEDDVDTVAQYWLAMKGICDAGLTRLADLISRHPDCNAGIISDRLLDLRNKCQRLYQMHA